MKPRVVVELYGTARARVGRAEVEVHADTVGEALQEGCPTLCDGGRLSGQYLVSLDGVRFVTMDEPVTEGMRLVVLGADAGG